MRIALLSLYLPGGSKIGVGHQVHGLADALVARGHDVTVFSPDEPGEGATYRWEPIAGGPPLRLVRVAAAVRRLDLSSFDVVHAHGEDWLLAGRPRRGHVRTLHGSGWSEMRRVPGLREKARMTLIGATEVVASMTADRTVAVSEATRRMAPWAGRVIPCGVDTAAFDAVPRTDTVHPTILFVGTFANRKRGRLLWEAFAEVVRPALPDAELWMVCDDAPVAPGVRVLGRVPARALVEAYRSAWVFCLPSTYEGFGVPYAEALAAGTPVVATPNPGASEVLEGGRLGRLVDADGLGRALVDLLDDADRRAAMAAAGRVAATRFDWAAVAAAYEEVYAEAMASPPARRRTGRLGPAATDATAPSGSSPSPSPSRPAVPGPDRQGNPGPDHRRVPEVRRPALFASSFHPHLGGVEELVRQLAHAQRARGVEPVVHTMRWPRSLPARERWEGLDIRRHAYRAPEGSVRRVATAAVGNPVVLADVVAQLRRDGADLVHVQCVSHGAWFAHQAARVLDLPLVVTLQGELTMDADDVYAHSPTLRHTLRSLLRHADRVTACSAATLAEAEAWAGLDLGERGSVVPNGIDLGEFDRPAVAGGPAPHVPAPYVVALGRHVPQKGFDVLLEAFALASGGASPALGAPWRLVVAGDGPERPALEARARRLGLGDRVCFPGRLERPEVVALLAAAELFVLPSRHEPFGIVNLEAMAARTAVVAADVGGVGEFVHHDANGVLVAPEDPGALATALAALAADPGRRARLVDAGRVTAEAHDWKAVEARYRDVYEGAMAAHGRRGGGRVAGRWPRA